MDQLAEIPTSRTIQDQKNANESHFDQSGQGDMLIQRDQLGKRQNQVQVNSSNQQLLQNQERLNNYAASLPYKVSDQFANGQKIVESFQNSTRITDETIFEAQKKEAERKKMKHEQDHQKNQQYISNLNYTKILSDNIKSQKLQTSLNQSQKESNQNSLNNSFKTIQLGKHIKIRKNVTTNHEDISHKMDIEEIEKVRQGRSVHSDQMQFEEKELSIDSSREKLARNIKPQQSEIDNQGGQGSGTKRFKKQNLKKPDVDPIVPSQPSHNGIDEQEDENSRLSEDQGNEGVSFTHNNNNFSNNIFNNKTVQNNSNQLGAVGMKRNLNLNKSRTFAANFAKDAYSQDEEESNENQYNDNHKKEQTNDIFEQFEFKKKSMNPKQISDPLQGKKIINKRTKAAREKMQGYSCGMCKSLHDTLGDDFCSNCSRHKGEFTPPHTPEAHYQKFSQSQSNSPN